MEVPDFLRIEHSPIHGHGIFANRTLEPGLILGPYKGEKIYDTNDTDYAWDIDPEDEKGGEAWMVDALPLDKSNYLRYINDPFGTGKEENLVAFQITERIFYLVCKRIEKDEELLISYGNAYWEARGHMDNKSDEECSDNSSKNCERTCKVSN
uniref:SET domain-containing protein n=1 Tax=Acrobeloides nanus TaxID=290746 RepID=A0A914C0M6_9BILA